MTLKDTAIANQNAAEQAEPNDELDARVLAAVTAHRRATSLTTPRFPELHKQVGGTLPEFLGSLVRLAMADKVWLRPWTGAPSDCPAPEYVLRMADQHKFFADIR